MAGELMESELFGHKKGAFTGADTDRKGLVQMASGGTIFLDEIGELPVQLQVKLLGVLERRKVTQLGSTQPESVDVRVVAATHRDLAREVNRGGFRADLFHRLCVVRLMIPPLRERLDDIPQLVEKFLGDLRQREGSHIPTELSAVTLAHLLAQPWPGNVRELRNVIESTVLSLGGQSENAGQAAPETFADARDRFVRDYERRYLVNILEATNMNVSEAARRAGIERSNFYRLLRRHQLVPQHMKTK
jgi:two-component system response regulator GlrR